MYSDDYTHTDVRMRRLDASRKLYDQCDDNAFVACMAEKTGTYTDNNGDSFITSCEDDDHDHYYDDWYYYDDHDHDDDDDDVPKCMDSCDLNLSTYEEALDFCDSNCWDSCPSW